MIFANRESYGVKNDFFLNDLNIGYVNLSKVKTIKGITAGSASAADNDKQLSLIKSYSEHLERLSLGIPIKSKEKICSINVIKKMILTNKFNEFSYGKHLLGYNDTTGTASGNKTEQILPKAVSELIEKNELFCFWYGSKGERVYCDSEIDTLISRFNFISNVFKIYLITELTNYPTIIVLGFLEDELLTSGISCSSDVDTSIENALREAKSIEWQTFSNPLTGSYKFSKEIMQIFYEKIKKKEETYKLILRNSIKNNKTLKFADWIDHIECAIIGDDLNRGIKTIKCISNQLLNSIPIKKNIYLQKEKEIVIRYLDDYSVDCPIQ